MSRRGSDKRTVSVTSRQLWVVFLAAFVGVSAVIGAAAFLDQAVTVSNELTIETTGSGLDVTITGSYDIDLSGDWASANSVTINSSGGNATITSTGDTDLTFAVDAINGTWTHATSVNATAANITINPDDKNATTVGDSITAINFTDIKVDDGDTDFTYSASSTGLVIVTTNASDGTQYGLVDADSREGIDVATADASGQIVFNDVPAATDRSVRVEELGSLFIRDEENPHDLITQATATVRFYETVDDNPTIVERTASGGSIDLTGLPVDEEFVADIQAPGYHNRTVIIDDLSQQETAFLINKTNTSTVEVTFSVSDQTGDFGEDAEFTVQKAINRTLYNGTPSGFSWTNMAGDEIGSQNAFTTDLFLEDRYRLRIANDQGDTRILGAHVAEANQTVTVTIQDVTIDIQNHTTDISIGFEKDTDNDQIEFLYNDTETETTNLQVIIYERGNATNEVHNTTHAGPFGELFVEEDLTAREMNATWVVEFSGSRNGTVVDGQYLSGGRGNVDISAIPQWVREFAAVAAIILIPTVLGGSRAETAAVVSTAIAAMLWYVRWLPPEVSIMSILLAATIAVGFKMRQRARDNIA